MIFSMCSLKRQWTQNVETDCTLKLDVTLVQLPNAFREISSWTLYFTPLIINIPFQPCESEINYHFHTEGFLTNLFDKDAHSEGRCDELPGTSDDEHMIHRYQQLCMSWLKTQTKPQQRNSGHLGHCLRVQNKHYVFVTRIRFCVEGEKADSGKTGETSAELSSSRLCDSIAEPPGVFCSQNIQSSPCMTFRPRKAPENFFLPKKWIKLLVMLSVPTNTS